MIENKKLLTVIDIVSERILSLEDDIKKGKGHKTLGAQTLLLNQTILALLQGKIPPDLPIVPKRVYYGRKVY